MIVVAAGISPKIRYPNTDASVTSIFDITATSPAGTLFVPPDRAIKLVPLCVSCTGFAPLVCLYRGEDTHGLLPTRCEQYLIKCIKTKPTVMPKAVRYLEIIKTLYCADPPVVDGIENPFSVNDSNGKKQNYLNTHFYHERRAICF
jgi:hypothetical protein